MEKELRVAYIAVIENIERLPDQDLRSLQAIINDENDKRRENSIQDLINRLEALETATNKKDKD